MMMSLTTKYKTRKSGRFNTPGQFVPSEQLPVQSQGVQNVQNVPAYVTPRKPQPPPPKQNSVQQKNLQSMQQQNLQPVKLLEDTDVEMKLDPEEADNSDSSSRPHWMKSKLVGVKKISNKERRRRQNQNLRRLITPKNALMVLNEMKPNEQISNQFKVEAGQPNPLFKGNNTQNFRAELTVDGQVYEGYGENKMMARNAAAEQAIRALIIKRMAKVPPNEDTDGQNGESSAMSGEEGSEEPLPMIQLASYALHKLFAEWEYEGHKVPQLKPLVTPTSISDCLIETPPLLARTKTPAVKEVPANASSMHPCMLLTYMRPRLEYRELSVEGDRPQNMVFTLGVDVDGATYIGNAPNKKEARKQAAIAACQALFNVQFTDTIVAQKPKTEQ